MYNLEKGISGNIESNSGVSTTVKTKASNAVPQTYVTNQEVAVYSRESVTAALMMLSQIPGTNIWGTNSPKELWKRKLPKGFSFSAVPVVTGVAVHMYGENTSEAMDIIPTINVNMLQVYDNGTATGWFIPMSAASLSNGMSADGDEQPIRDDEDPLGIFWYSNGRKRRK